MTKRVWLLLLVPFVPLGIGYFDPTFFRIIDLNPVLAKEAFGWAWLPVTALILITALFSLRKFFLSLNQGLTPRPLMAWISMIGSLLFLLLMRLTTRELNRNGPSSDWGWLSGEILIYFQYTVFLMGIADSLLSIVINVSAVSMYQSITHSRIYFRK